MIGDVRARLWTNAWRHFWCGSAFMVAGTVIPNAMHPIVYGEWAYSIAVEVWAFGFMAAAILVIYGLHINGRSPMVSPVIMLLGYASLFCLYTALVVSAATAPAGIIIVVFAPIFFLDDLQQSFRLILRLWLQRWRVRRGTG